MNTIYFKDDKQVTAASLFEDFLFKLGNNSLDGCIAIPCTRTISNRMKRSGRLVSRKRKHGKGTV
jgi:hypothetical protein